MKRKLTVAITGITLLVALAIPVRLVAQAQEQENESSTAVTTNPVPLINQPLLPDAIRPGGAGFTLTVNGTGFVLGSVVKWNGSARTTTFVSSYQLKASILTSDIGTRGMASVTVTNPTPGGGTSNAVSLEVTSPTLSVSMRTLDFAAGTHSSSVVTGDFNRDGKPDLAVANNADNTVSVLLGNGDGTFRPAVNYGAESFPSSVALADFNGDGKLDLAVANQASSNVSVLLGNGDGTFQAAVDYNVEQYPSSVAVGDFGGDGKLDLAVADISGISILLGNGNGTFQPAVNYGVGSVGSGPAGVSVGDFNRDGKLDLAVANFNTSNVCVLLGNGDGTFQAAVDYNVGHNPNSAPAVADFNGDGKLDLAVANANSSNISILLGNGDGTFQPTVNYGVGSVPGGISVGDFNGDGKLDLAAADGSGTSILLGKGDGTFQGATSYEAGSTAASLAVGDFNSDGRLDLAVVNTNDNGSTADSVFVLLQATVVSLLPTSLKFGDQVVGTGSAGQTVTLMNTGYLALKITGFSITGTNAADFSQANDCGTSVSPGASCTVSVTFKPTRSGPRTAAVTITDDAVVSPQSVALTGTGVTSGPNVTFSRPSITFTTQVVGATSPAESVMLTNYGATALSIAGIGITGANANDFAQTHTCGTSLAEGASCSISVTFKPAASGTRTAALSISDNAAGSPQKVALSGVGTTAKLSPLSLSFGSVVIGETSPSQTVTLTNVGRMTVSITGITITGMNPGDFAQTHTCGSSLAASTSCSITITFKPLATGGRTAALSVSDNGSGSPQAVSLNGTGVAGSCIRYGETCTPVGGFNHKRCCSGLVCAYCGLHTCCL